MTTLTILGLGPGDAADLTRRAWTALETAKTVYLRTRLHPCVPELPGQERYHSFDGLYEQSTEFSEVYDGIVQQLLEAAAQDDVVYAVPGDPFVGESTTSRLIEGAQQRGIVTEVIHGISFIEPMLAQAGIDAIDDLQITDALVVAALHHPQINPDAPALISQVYSRQVASDVKLTLMNQYPDDFNVRLIHAAGNDEAVVEELPLYEIDHSEHIGHLTSLYLPALGQMSSFERFQEIIAHLRAPEGCPWDRKQTHESLRPYLIEEAYEVLDTIDRGDMAALSEELGDLLLQIVLHTQIATEDGDFYMADVLRQVNQKMIRRHPHVWGEVNAENPDQVIVNWEAIKQQEKATRGEEKPKSILDGVQAALPALMQAYKVQAKAAKVGFDWDKVDDVRAKVLEEIDEVQRAASDEERLDETGDLLFALVNWIRWLGVGDPEAALRMATLKFRRRFEHVEEQVRASGKEFSAFTLAELDQFWDQAKQQEREAQAHES
jgi:tetrapyrrole methylase family protein / MazG family protein